MLNQIAWSFEVIGQNVKPPDFKFIDSYFENASPLMWEIAGDTAVKIELIYNYERESVNRASGHWYFMIEADPGTELNLILSNMVNIYNGKKTGFVGNKEEFVACYFSEDQENWKGVKTRRLPNNLDFQVKYKMKNDKVYIARMPPYTEKDLEEWKGSIAKQEEVEIIPAGKTVEGRPLEIVRVGNPDAKFSVLMRVRAHAWETAGNFVVEGLVQEYLSNQKDYQDLCYYIMPMANKDAVSRGMTRFNTKGVDLNRGWFQEPDSINAPEKLALENFIKKLIANGKKPALAIDFHCDDYGYIHLTVPKKSDSDYSDNMIHLHSILSENTWFSQRLYTNKNPTGNLADGMYHRYGIDGLIFEFNANYIEKLDKIPESKDWMSFGAKLNFVFREYMNRGL